MEENLEQKNEFHNDIKDKTNKSISEQIKESTSERDINMSKNNEILQNKSSSKDEVKNENNTPIKTIPKPIKELPIEKKPFQEFINTHLIPELIKEIKLRGLEIKDINLKNTNRPIARDKCWVINCEIIDISTHFLASWTAYFLSLLLKEKRKRKDSEVANKLIIFLSFFFKLEAHY